MTDNNIINFPRIGFARSSSGSGQPPSSPPVTPSSGDGSGRRSPLQIVAGSTANPPAVRQAGHTPATFRAGVPDDNGPRLGALSMAAVLAVAVAALRGTVKVLQDRRQRRMQHELEQVPLRAARLKNQLAMEQARYAVQEAAMKHAADRQQARDKHANTMQGIGDKSAEQRAKNKKVPSSHEFGRKTLGGGGSKGGSKGGGKGAGSGGRSGGKSGGGPGSKRNTSDRGAGKGLSGGGSSGVKSGRKNADISKKSGGGLGGKSPSGSRRSQGAGGGEKGGRKRSGGLGGTRSPKRLSQGGATGALQKRQKQNGGGAGSGKGNGSQKPGSRGPTSRKQQRGKTSSGRTTLGQAAGRQLSKAMQRRFKRRRKNLSNPALWANPKSPKASMNRKAAKRNGQGAAGTAKTQRNPGTFRKKRRTGRTTLAGAMGYSAYRAAYRRLKKRRQAGAVPPVWGAARKPRRSAGKKTPGSGQTGSSRRKQQAGRSGSRAQRMWQRARARARKATGQGGCFPGAGPNAAGAQQQAPQGAGGGRTGGGPRRSPFENVPQGGTTTWIEREDYVGAQAKRWEPAGIGQAPQALPAKGPAALPAAPEPQFARPGTTRPPFMPPTPNRPATAEETSAMTSPVPAVRSHAPVMDSQHATEITVDDAVDAGIKLKNDGFKTNEQSGKLAQRARRLRDTLRTFAEHLAVQNNVIGPRFSGAMDALGESMDVLARMADEMERESLFAAEKAEGAANRIEDAYRPISQATADAGLSTPSAPAHNET